MGRTRAERRAGRAIRRQRRVVERYRAFARSVGYELTDWQIRMLAAYEAARDSGCTFVWVSGRQGGRLVLQKTIEGVHR
ncbi:hypothetical protein J2X55_002416 [Microbacterium sp. 1154]|nr:hypothetical protein [Microbacterium sp. 1154]